MKIFLFVITLAAFANNSYAEIYKWVDDQGKVHFSGRKPANHDAEPIKLRINTYTSITYAVSKIDHGQKVVMYSTSWCAYCKKAKQYFKKNNIKFTEYDIEENARARKRYKKLGATGVPVIVVGQKRMNGFSIKGFERIYR
ncbi:MAG: DUF4124 domain-containing protein [Gammaproteobacteria bacterium]|nr:DUF4124 domain-containing protein [Gammaproteobacteria bacterium]